MLGHARDIASRFEVALYTNNGPLTRAMLPELFPEAHALFGARAFFSYEFNTKKPDPAAYSRLLSCGVRIFEYVPRVLHAKALLVDDR